MSRAIITGATGAIGVALIKELVANGVEVLVLCREKSTRNRNIIEHPLVTKKLCSLEQLANIENDTGKIYDFFFHLAWEGTVGNARNNMYIQNKNVQYVLEAIDVAVRFGCSKFIGIGSQAEYGKVDGVINMNTPTNPITGYGMAKLCAGLMAKEYASQRGIQFNWIRVLSVYGPCDYEKSMIMTVISKLKKNEEPMLTLGEQLWDYLYSEDAARAIYGVALRGKKGKTYVLGGGEVRTISSYVDVIHERVNPTCGIALGAIPYSDNQIMHLQADITELISDISWKPMIGFEEGIERVLHYMEEVQD
ncbi:MAG: NAD-dependent epimerase/dehydratase [Lachnospiraceae bacterium]|nr:NAD-dependent epimerase/dehydratase [Lachnospiraceae bacterium]